MGFPRCSARSRRRVAFASPTAPLAALFAVLMSAPAHAEPMNMATQQYSKTTRDGWQLMLSIDNERVNSVPNLAAAVNS
jgi:hypothetical protein